MRRRNFLVSTAGMLTLRPACLRAQNAPPSALSFIVVTDTHLGYKDKDAAQKLWRQTAAEIAAVEGAFVLHLGDVIDGGRVEQYPVYLEGRKLISKPVYEVPGNHDPVAGFQQHLRPQVDTFFDHQWLRVVLMNNARRDSHEGFFTSEQIAWLGRTCDEAAAKNLNLLLCCHVPVHDNKHPDRGWHVKPGSGQAEFYEIAKKHAPRILAAFHGHFHNGLRGWNNHAPMHEVCFPSALYNQDRKLESQQAPGYNPPEFRPGFTLVTIANGAMQMRFQAVGDEPKPLRELQLGAA